MDDDKLYRQEPIHANVVDSFWIFEPLERGVCENGSGYRFSLEFILT